MRRLTLGALLVFVAAAGERSRAVPPTPVLVELFTSEGCSSCPPADQLLERMAGAPGVENAVVIPLGEHVDYWDELGWRDRFSSAAFTARQQRYAVRFGGEGPYTPQLVIDGRTECVGSDVASARRAIANAAAQPHGTLTLQAADGRVRASATDLPQKAGDRADVFVAITEDRLRSDVTRGENRGRTLTHAAVVRTLVTAGEAVGPTALVERAVALDPAWRRDALRLVAFVQARRSGVVLAAASVPLVPRP